MNYFPKTLRSAFSMLSGPARQAPSLTSQVSRSYSRMNRPTDFPDRSLTMKMRSNISYVIRPQQDNRSELKLGSDSVHYKKARHPEDQKEPVVLHRKDLQSALIEAVLKGQNPIVHAQSPELLSDLETTHLSALFSPHRQYDVLGARQVFASAPEGKDFGAHVDKVCKAYVSGDTSGLKPAEMEDFERLSTSLSSLKVALDKGHTTLQGLQKVVPPEKLGLKEHHRIPHLGIMPINGSRAGYTKDGQLGTAAKLAYFEAVCKGLQGSPHPVSLSVDLNRDPEECKAFLEQGMVIAEKFGTPVTIVNDWSPTGHAQNIQRNLDLIQEYCVKGENSQQPHVSFLLNASQLEMQSAGVQEVFKKFFSQHKPLAFAHNASIKPKENPLYADMLATGTVEDAARLKQDVSEIMGQVVPVLNQAIEQQGSFPEVFRIR